MDETRMKGGLSRSAGIPAGLGRLELVCAPAPRCSWGAAGSFVRGKPAGMPALRTTRGSARPIFIVWGAVRGMESDQKMPPRAPRTQRRNASESFSLSFSNRFHPLRRRVRHVVCRGTVSSPARFSNRLRLLSLSLRRPVRILRSAAGVQGALSALEDFLRGAFGGDGKQQALAPVIIGQRRGAFVVGSHANAD